MAGERHGHGMLCVNRPLQSSKLQAQHFSLKVVQYVFYFYFIIFIRKLAGKMQRLSLLLKTIPPPPQSTIEKWNILGHTSLHGRYYISCTEYHVYTTKEHNAFLHSYSLPMRAVWHRSLTNFVTSSAAYQWGTTFSTQTLMELMRLAVNATNYS